MSTLPKAHCPSVLEHDLLHTRYDVTEPAVNPDVELIFMVSVPPLLIFIVLCEAQLCSQVTKRKSHF